jgi:hypothetical protein
MILTPQDTQRFYAIWFPLLHFVNERRSLVPSFPATYGAHSVSPDDAATLRDALWSDDTLLEAFVAENPAGLGGVDLDLVTSWKTRVSGDFYFFRQLKKYAVFLPQGESARAYAVLGLVSPIEEIVPIPPPCLVQTTLLPFEGKIIYDSLLRGYNVYFGSGIRSSLNETYKAAQERGTFITSLEAVDANVSPDAIRARNTKLLLAYQKHITRANMSLKTLERHRATVEHFAEEYLLRQRPPRGLIETTAQDLANYLNRMGDEVNRTSFKHFARFLRDTARLDWQEAEAMLAELRE